MGAPRIFQTQTKDNSRYRALELLTLELISRATMTMRQRIGNLITQGDGLANTN